MIESILLPKSQSKVGHRPGGRHYFSLGAGFQSLLVMLAFPTSEKIQGRTRPPTVHQ